MDLEELINYLCGVLEFRFLAGVEGAYLKPIFSKLDPNLMHYIPAISADTAIAMANGVYIGNIKSAVIMKESDFERVKDSLILPIMIIVVASITYKPKGIKSYKLNNKTRSVLKKANNYIETKELPCMVLIDSKEFV